MGDYLEQAGGLGARWLEAEMCAGGTHELDSNTPLHSLLNVGFTELLDPG